MTSVSYFPLSGGEDLLTPSLSAEPGTLRFSRNYECDRYGRYRRIDGYERLDGQLKPSLASYWVLNFDAGTSVPSVGDTISGATSSASGKIYSIVVSSGTWAGGDAAGYFVVLNISGTFQDDENLVAWAVVRAVVNGVALEHGADNDTEHDTWLQAAIESARSDIQAVPGSGTVLGVWSYNGVKYAFRNNAGGTAAALYKSSSTGWVLCDLGRTIPFTSGGTYEIQEDDTITGVASAATATVKRIIITSGTFAAGDAAGTLVLYSQSGTFQAENLDVGANSNVATIAGNSTATTLLPDGRYEFVDHNFYGHSSTKRVYGCDGVNKGFEWDGSTYAPITTGMTTDAPTHVAAHKNHLFFLFPGGSLQHSSTGEPHIWSAITGAAEMGLGDEGVGMDVMPGDVLAVWSRNSTHLLYGSGLSDWDLRTHSNESGAIEWTVQKMGVATYLDDRGLTNLSAVQQYGDFADNVISERIQPFLDGMRGLEQSSIRVRKKNQYRIFFSDKHGVIMTMKRNKIIGFTRVKYDHVVSCCCSAEDSNGNEELLFGSTDGYVYQMDSGTSFDGGAVSDYLKTHFNIFKTPSHKKRFRKLSAELDAPNNIDLSVQPEFSYGSGDQSISYDLGVDASGGFWDIDEWGSFIWDGPTVATGEARIDGSGLSLALNFYHTGIYDAPHTIQGMVVHYDVRGLQR